MSSLVRGRIYRARIAGLRHDKYFLVVSNNQRNRNLDSVLAVRFTTTPKPDLPSIIEVPKSETLPGGRIVCDDIYELYDDEVRADMGALSPTTMQAVADGLKAALALS